MGLGKGMKFTKPPIITQETLWTHNTQLNGIEIQFSSNPPDAIKAQIRLHGFRVARDRRIKRIYWWARATPDRVAVAEKAVRDFKAQEDKTR